ncbi:hypothetical protein IPN35_05055 [Candidatus Peregrinibacteria bacterium]|nr:MAG: hypothetical protein IPN35_05055 [Candidatus Peregrinibacteria bacterium]
MGTPQQQTISPEIQREQDLLRDSDKNLLTNFHRRAEQNWKTGEDIVLNTLRTKTEQTPQTPLDFENSPENQVEQLDEMAINLGILIAQALQKKPDLTAEDFLKTAQTRDPLLAESLQNLKSCFGEKSGTAVGKFVSERFSALFSAVQATVKTLETNKDNPHFFEDLLQSPQEAIGKAWNTAEEKAKGIWEYVSKNPKQALVTGGIILGGAWMLSKIFGGNKKSATQEAEKEGGFFGSLLKWLGIGGLGAGIFMAIGKGPGAVGKWVQEQISGLTDKMAQQFMEKVKEIIPESMHGILGLDGKGGGVVGAISEGMETAHKEYADFLKEHPDLAKLLPENLGSLLGILGVSAAGGLTLKKLLSGSSKEGKKGLFRFLLGKAVSAPIGVARLIMNPLVLLTGLVGIGLFADRKAVAEDWKEFTKQDEEGKSLWGRLQEMVSSGVETASELAEAFQKRTSEILEIWKHHGFGGGALNEIQTWFSENITLKVAEELAKKTTSGAGSLWDKIKTYPVEMGAGVLIAFVISKKLMGHARGNVLKYSAIAGAFGLGAYLANIGAEGRTRFYAAFSKTWQTLRGSGRELDPDVFNEVFPKWMEESLEEMGVEFPDTALRKEDSKTILSSLNSLEAKTQKNTDQKTKYFREAIAEIRRAIQNDSNKEKVVLSSALFTKLIFFAKELGFSCSVADGKDGTFVLTIDTFSFPGFQENPFSSAFEMTEREEKEQRKMSIQAGLHRLSVKIAPYSAEANKNETQKNNAKTILQTLSTVQDALEQPGWSYDKYETHYQKIVSALTIFGASVQKTSGTVYVTLPAGDRVDMGVAPNIPREQFLNNLSQREGSFLQKGVAMLSPTAAGAVRGMENAFENINQKTARLLLHFVPAGSDMEKKIYDLLANPEKLNDATWLAQFIATIVTSDENIGMQLWTGGASLVIGSYEFAIEGFSSAISGAFSLLSGEDFNEVIAQSGGAILLFGGKTIGAVTGATTSFLRHPFTPSKVLSGAKFGARIGSVLTYLPMKIVKLPLKTISLYNKGKTERATRDMRSLHTPNIKPDAPLFQEGVDGKKVFRNPDDIAREMEGKPLSSTDDYLKKAFSDGKSIPRIDLPENFDELLPEEKATALQKNAENIVAAEKGVNARIQHELDKVADYAKQNKLPHNHPDIQAKLKHINEEMIAPLAREKLQKIAEINKHYGKLPKSVKTPELKAAVRSTIYGGTKEGMSFAKFKKAATGRVKMMGVMALITAATDTAFNWEKIKNDPERELAQLMTNMGPQAVQILVDCLPLVGTYSSFHSAFAGTDMITGNDASSFGQRVANSIFGVVGIALDAASIASLGAGVVPATLARVVATTAKMGRRGEKIATMITDILPQIAKIAEKMGGWKNFAKKFSEMLSGGFDKIAKYGTYAGTAVVVGSMGISLFESNFGSFDPEDLDPDLRPD